MGYSRYEQETSIVWDEEDKIARIYTTSPQSMRKLDKLCEQFPDTYKSVPVKNPEESRKYEVNKRFIRFGKPASEARKEAARRNAERMLGNRKESD